MLRRLGLIVFRLAVFVAFFALQYAIWLSDNGFRRWYDLRMRLNREQSGLQIIQESNDKLAQVVHGLQEGGEVTEHFAREKMYMIGEDETLYQFD